MGIIDSLLHRRRNTESSRGKLKAEAWAHRWANADQQYAMNDWRLPPGGHDPSVVAAVESGWLEPGLRVLDLGCGDGAVAAYLADAGFDAVGIDYAPAAIELARRQYASAERLRYEVADVLAYEDDVFDALIDRGCFHGFHGAERNQYLHTVLALTRPGSRFLLICAIKEGRKGERGERIDHKFVSTGDRLQTRFASSFDIESVERTVINGRGNLEDSSSVPAIAMRMTRR